MLSLLILPLQNAWSMANASHCGMMMSSVEMSDDAMVNCQHDSSDMAMGQDCSDHQCGNCSHVSSFIISDLNLDKKHYPHINISFTNSLYRFLLSEDNPPPIIS